MWRRELLDPCMLQTKFWTKYMAIYGNLFWYSNDKNPFRFIIGFLLVGVFFKYAGFKYQVWSVTKLGTYLLGKWFFLFSSPRGCTLSLQTIYPMLKIPISLLLSLLIISLTHESKIIKWSNFELYLFKDEKLFFLKNIAYHTSSSWDFSKTLMHFIFYHVLLLPCTLYTIKNNEL